MANWQHQSKIATESIDDKLDEAFKGRGYSEASMVNKEVVSVVGINTSQVGFIIEAINKYVDNINKKIDEIDSDADMNSAIRGAAIQAAIKEYIKSVKEYCQKLSSYLGAFSIKLESVKNAWEQYIEATAQTINESKTELNNFSGYANTSKYNWN